MYNLVKEIKRFNNKEKVARGRKKVIITREKKDIKKRND